MTHETEPDPRQPVSMIEIRRRTVDAVESQRQLEQRRRAAAALAERLEEMAVQALTEDRDLVRELLDQRVEALIQVELLAEQLRAATETATRLKADMLEGGTAPN